MIRKILFILLFLSLALPAGAQIGAPCEGPVGQASTCKGGLVCQCVNEDNKGGICVLKDKEFVCPFTTYRSIEEILKTLMDYLFWLAIVACPLVIVIGAFMFMTSGGDPSRTRMGKSLITWAIIGLVVILFSKIFYTLIANIITPNT